MYKNGRYQFTLVFPPGEVSDKVGRVLENMGRYKSIYIVQAMSEYIEKHPELNYFQQSVLRQHKSVIQEKKNSYKKAQSKTGVPEIKEPTPAPKQDANAMQMLFQQMLMNNPDLMRQMSESLSVKASKDEDYDDEDEFDDGDDMMLSAFRSMGDT